MQMKSVFETKMQRQHELSEVKQRKILCWLFMRKILHICVCSFFNVHVLIEIQLKCVFALTELQSQCTAGQIKGSSPSG